MATLPTTFAPGAFQELGEDVFEGYIDTNNVIHMRWPPTARKPEMQQEAAQHLGTDAVTAKRACERAAYDVARHLKCTKMQVKASWHAFTKDTAAGSSAVATPDSLHVALRGSQSTAWTGSFKTHVYQDPSQNGNDILAPNSWKPKITTFIENKGFCPKLSTREASNWNDQTVVDPTPRVVAAPTEAPSATPASSTPKAAPTPRAAPAPKVAPSGTPGSSTPKVEPARRAASSATPWSSTPSTKPSIPQGVPSDAQKCVKAGKPTYYMSKDKTKFWDSNGKQLSQKPW